MVALSTLSALTTGISVVMLIPMLAVLDISGDSSQVAQLVAMFLGDLSKGQLIAVILGTFLALMIFRALLSAALSVLNERMVGKYTLELRTSFYEAIASAEWQRFKRLRRSDLSNYFAVETNRISYSATLAIKLVVLVITTLVNLVIAFIMSPVITICMALLGIVAFVGFRAIRKLTRANGRQVQAANENLMAEVKTQLDGIREIKGYRVEKQQAHLFAQAAEDYRLTRLRYAKLSAVPQAILSVGAALIVVCVFLVAYLVLKLSIARIAVLIYVLGRIWPSLSTLQSYTQSLHNVLPTYENIVGLIRELQRTKMPDLQESDVVSLSEAITFENVNFSYEDSNEDDPLLENINATFKKGEIIALVGPNGAGKSTLVDVLLGFLSPTSGRVMFDGQDMAAFGGALRRYAISYIPQEPLMLSATVRENLMRFHPNASEDDIMSALKTAQAFDIIEALPQGLDTMLGDEGIRLSGGERQRIVLARALMGSPSLIVLDEATSALDFESESKIHDVLIGLKGKITVLMIAHRPSTVKSADQVIVLENGHISESGTFEELRARQTSYLSRMLS